MKIIIALVLMCSLVCMPATGLRGEIFSYVDDHGTVGFTDSRSKIPARYRERAKVHKMTAGGVRIVTPVSIENNQVLVPVTVTFRGKRVQAVFLFDTGASSCTISPKLAEKLEINANDADVRLARVVGGDVHAVSHVKLDELAVGPYRKTAIDAAVIATSGNDGLLGMNFLRELKYHIDFNDNLIRWGE